MSTNTGNKGKVFSMYVQAAFDAAAEDFRADPSANNWHDLKVAMWAWQHVYGLKDQLTDAAHEHLRSIAVRAKGDENFSEA